MPLFQQPIQLNKLPCLQEDRFKSNFVQFTRSKGIRLNKRDLVIDGQAINLWALHKAVFSRDGFESVSAHDEWPVIGVALGFPSIPGGDAGRPSRSRPVIAHGLQQLYNDVLRHFDQLYISSIRRVIARLRSQASGAQPPQPQAQPHQPTILPRFSHTSGAELEAHHVPQNVITFVARNREHLQRAAQDQNGFSAGLTFTKNAPLDNRTQVNHASAPQTMARPQQFIPNHQQPQRVQRQGLVQASGNPNTLAPGRLFNGVGPLVPPSTAVTAQSIRASSIPSMGAQMTSSNSSGGVRNQGGKVAVSTNPAAMNGVTSGSIQSSNVMQIRHLTQEDIITAKRLVNEKKRMAFSCG
ncbi:hypothetical protein DFH94DRAFT_622620 [Russula ochroleuca]|uniref:ARID domain-containing protein n=1 Tax=Russula ochroleuca TaxID=152965 RepID=A0A9P5TCV9_9AGAM|nr:hypothetical protein DFH94DRAFT_622620 [Russula ochroleuca]